MSFRGLGFRVKRTDLYCSDKAPSADLWVGTGVLYRLIVLLQCVFTSS